MRSDNVRNIYYSNYHTEKNKIMVHHWSAHEMMVLITSACGEGSDKPACMHDLARDFRFSHKLRMQVEEDSEQLLDI